MIPQPTSPEPISVLPTYAVRVPVLRQTWSSIVFVHWEIDADEVRPVLPPGVRPDLFQGRAYVGLVALALRTSLLGVVPVPYLGTLVQVNVRVYGVDDRGRRGIVLCSVDANRLVPALVGRYGLGLPYAWSRVRGHSGLPADASAADPRGIGYHVGRRGSAADGPSLRLAVAVGPPTSGTALEHFLTARWVAFGELRSRPWWCATEHHPWPLHEATVTSFEGDLVALTAPRLLSAEPISVLAAPQVHAGLSVPAPLGADQPRGALRLVS